MAECNISIDQNKLPGVKEVCKDFAVLEDHCLAYNLQEQEIESHLASNVHKSRLVQKDLQVAKRLQEEEDERSQKQHVDIERQDNEIAQEIQEKLVRQAEQQRQQQEEEDAAIARKLQEKEKIREERRRQKQQDANIKEDYYEDHGASRSRDVDRHQKTQSLGRYDAYSPVRLHQDDSSEYYSAEPKKSRYPRQDSAAPHGRSRYPEHYLMEGGGRSKHADPYPEHLLPSRGKHEDRYPEFEPAHMARDERGRDADREMRRKERPARPPPPKTAVERGEVMDREKHKYDREKDYNWDKHVEKDYRRDREQDLRPAREREKSRDRQPSGDGQGERDRQRQKDKERQKARSRDREFEEDYSEPGRSRDRPRDSRASWEEEEIEGERRARSRQRVQSNPVDVFDEFMKDKGRGDSRERLEEGEAPGWERSYSHSSRETGRVVHKGSGAVLAEKEYGLNEATRELTKLDLREQELKDMEVARKLQEEELKASNMHARAAQVAKDEELARRMMEQDKKEYKKNREREKEKERERVAMDRMAVDKRRQEANYRPNSEEVVRPRTREEYEYQRQRTDNKPARPPQPRTHDYENVNSGYGYPEHLAPSRPPARPEAAYRGAYHKR